MVSLLVIAAASTAPASANGAFPDSQALWWEPDGKGLVLATNFGLVRSDDAGTSWTWTCEVGWAAGGSLYAETATQRLFTLATAGLVSSDDRGCSWRAAATTLTAHATDYFLDPTDPGRIWLISDAPADGGAASRSARSLYLSRDGGDTYDFMASVPVEDGAFTGVETGHEDPSFVVVTVQRPAPSAALLGISRDGGASFRWASLEGLAPVAAIRLLGLDRATPGRFYLRVTFVGHDAAGTTDDGLVVVTVAGTDGALNDASVKEDAGPAISELRLALAVPVRITGGLMTAFLQRQNGDVLVAGQSPQGPWAFRASAGDASFAPWPTGSLHMKALAEHAGLLYVAADQLGSADPFAVGESDDDGAHWHPLLASFRQVDRVASCASSECQETCTSYVDFGLFAPTLCRGGADGAASPRDGGSESDGGTHDGLDHGDAATGARASGGAGCACTTAASAVSSGLVVSASLLALVLALASRSRQRRARQSPARPHRSRSA